MPIYQPLHSTRQLVPSRILRVCDDGSPLGIRNQVPWQPPTGISFVPYSGGVSVHDPCHPCSSNPSENAPSSYLLDHGTQSVGPDLETSNAPLFLGPASYQAEVCSLGDPSRNSLLQYDLIAKMITTQLTSILGCTGTAASTVSSWTGQTTNTSTHLRSFSTITARHL